MTTPDPTAAADYPGPPFYPHERVRVREGTITDLSALTGTVTEARPGSGWVTVRFYVDQVLPEEMVRSAPRWDR